MGTATNGTAAKDVNAIPRVAALARIVDADWFQVLISSVIVANAVVLGLETYFAPQSQAFATLMRINEVFYFIFLAELIVRIASYGRQPWNFFRSGWNIFDFIVIGGALVPALRSQAEIMRLLRLARIVRLLRFLPEARVLVGTLAKALPSVFSMLILVILIVFIYGMIGVTLFGESLPEQWGTIGAAMLTLFILLTLENFPTYLQEAQQVTPFATVFFISYILIAAFVVLNLLLGIVIGAMEEAREEERARLRQKDVSERQTIMNLLLGIHKQLNEVEQRVEEIGRRTT